MTSLTHLLENTTSPVAQWMRATFPHSRPALTEIRSAAGSAKILPDEPIAYGTQGGAIDWWLRFLVKPDEVPDMRLATQGLDMLEGTPIYDAGWPMFATMTGLSIGDGPPSPIDPPINAMRQLLNHSDEFQARTCFALSLLTECRRAGVRPGSRLMNVQVGSSPQELLDLATNAEVADLLAMRDSAQRIFLSHLAKQPVWTGPTFEGSRILAADADLIAGDTLVEIKATIGGPPRKDGTRGIKLDRDDLYQLIGYMLMDFSDRYQIRRIGIYLPRFEHVHSWPTDQLLQTMAGYDVDVPATRAAFQRLLHEQVPAYLRDVHGIDHDTVDSTP